MRAQVQPSRPGAAKTPSEVNRSHLHHLSGVIPQTGFAKNPHVRWSFRAPRRHDAHFDKLEAEASDPLQQALQGALI